MSQLNNTNEQENENPIIDGNIKKKMKTSTKIIIFLFVFLLICVSATIGAICFTNNNKASTPPSKVIEIADDGLGIKSLTEQYNENDLKIINVTDTRGNRIPKYNWDTHTGKININYIKIDGLKNTRIEDQINSEINALVYSLYDYSEINDSEIDYIEIYANCQANFGNTLSVDITKTIFYVDDDAEIDSTSYYLNYDLTTGNKIKFEDLFTNASLKNALAQCIYDNVVDNYIYLNEEDEWVIDMSKADLSTVEDETYILLNKIMNNLDDITFYYTPSYIYLDEYQLSITMSDIYSSIAIYNRFKTSETIFDGTYVGNKNMFVFSKRYSYVDTQYSKYEDIYHNFRVEAVVEMDNELVSDSAAKEKLNELIKKIEDEISTIKKEAKKNPKKAYLYTAYFSMYSGESFELSLEGIENKILNTWGESKVFRMTKEYYDKVFVAEMASFYNNPEPVEYWPVFEYYKEDKNVTIETVTEMNESIDLYTNKTEDQLIGESHINGEKRYLQEIQNTLSNGGTFDDLEDELTAVYNSIISIQKEYNLKDSDLEEALKLLDDVRALAKEKEQKQEILDNTTSTNILESTNLIVNNEL